MAENEATPNKAYAAASRPSPTTYGRGLLIALYTVTANDLDLIGRFVGNFAKVDLVVVADRGSNDGTPEELRRQGAQILDATGLSPDTARALALDAIPPGYVCIALEPTDLLQGNWREAVNLNWAETTTAGLHDATWFHGAMSRGWSDLVLARVHSRNALPIPDNAIGLAVGETIHLEGVGIEHRPHSRALSAGGLCGPGADRLQQGYALFLRGQLIGAAVALRQYLDTAPDLTMRLHAWRILSAALRLHGDTSEAVAVLRVAVAEFPDCRAVLADLTSLLHDTGHWDECYLTGQAASAMPWTGLYSSIGLRSSENSPFDIGALAAYNTDRFVEALRLGHCALARDPGSDRIRRNVQFYREAVVREGILPAPDFSRPRLILISGPWSGGTSAVAGMLARLGARGLGSYQSTPDPRTPNSYESMAFARAVDGGIEKREASVHRSDPTVALRLLNELREDMVWNTFTEFEEDVDTPFFAKYPASALLIEEIAEVFELQIVIVKRPFAEIEQTRIRRCWPALFGEAGAQIVTTALETPMARQFTVMNLEYGSVLADPLAAARRLARLIGNVPRARIEVAASFVAKFGASAWV